MWLSHSSVGLSKSVFLSFCSLTISINHALRRVRKFITPEKAMSLGNAFINSHFNYAPLIWMFCRKTSYNKIEKIHHKTLKVIYKSDDLYDDLLLRNNEVSIHQRHLRFLATEVFKSVNGLNPDFMSDYFTKKIMPYNLRRGEVLCLPKANSSYYGIHGFHFRGSILWNNLPLLVFISES